MPALKVDKVEWDLTPLLADESEELFWKSIKELQTACRNFVDKWKGRSDYLQQASSLKEALDDYENWSKLHNSHGKIGYYYHLKKAKNQNDSAVLSSYNKIDDFKSKISNDMKFFTLGLGKIERGKQEIFLKDGSLQKYRSFLRTTFNYAKHTLSEPEERILNLLGSNSYNKWVDMTQSLISKEIREIEIDGKTEKKNFEEILTLIKSSDKNTRDNAARLVNEILEIHSDCATNEINAVLSYRKTIDELRGFERPDKRRHMQDDIDSEIVDVLVESVTKRFDIANRYYKLKAKIMGLKKLEYHERNVEYGHIDGKYEYQKGIDVVYSAFEKLDPEFAKILSDFNKQGKIDVYPRPGKRGGAFCSHDILISPVYVLLNYTDGYQDVKTLAHEMGHAINFELSKKQNALNYDACLATAEVASTFMEDFVDDELLKEADDELKFSILFRKLGDEINTIIRQIGCYNFEKELHSEFRKKGYLSKEEIGSIFQKNMSSYMGDFVEQSKGSQNWWVYWSHIRTYFYVYSYSSGLLISKAMQSYVRKDKNFIKKVKEFLAFGVSESPRDIFLRLGIDITQKEFWDNGLKELDNLFDEVEVLAKKLGKI